jgi:hypothetical protein
MARGTGETANLPPPQVPRTDTQRIGINNMAWLTRPAMHE